MRRAVALLLAVPVLLTALVVVGGPGAGASSVADPRLGRAECALTGRVYLAGQGCSRDRCVAGARMDKGGHDAELCARTGRKGAPYGQPVASRRCRALGRVWIGAINICASNPDRSQRVRTGAPQCRDPRATYVDHREEEGWYDECLSPRRIAEIRRVAARQHVSVPRAAVDRSSANCSYRAGWVMSGGVCVVRQGPPPASALGGLFMTGDSVSWRADNELHARQRRWTLDLRPGRRLDELAGRLAWYRANHGEPDRVIIELGTNRRAGYTEDDFLAAMATVPATTPVLFLLPYREFTGDNRGLVKATKRYAGWMRSLAAQRPLTCLADWPSYAAAHLSNLVDGEHPDSRHEDWYARYVIRAWDGCEAELGL